MAQVFRRFNTFFWSNEKNDSMAALSFDVATCPIDASSLLDSMMVVNFRDRNWLPLVRVDDQTRVDITNGYGVG